MNQTNPVSFRAAALRGLSVCPITVSAEITPLPLRPSPPLTPPFGLRLDVRGPFADAQGLARSQRWREVATRVGCALYEAGVRGLNERRVDVVILCPAGVEPGAMVDLAVACAVAHALGHVHLSALSAEHSDAILYAELSLSAHLSAWRGLSCVARYAAEAKPALRVVSSLGSHDEAQILANLGVNSACLVDSLGALFAEVREGGFPANVAREAPAAAGPSSGSMSADLLTSAAGLRAVLCAAAGEHNVFFACTGNARATPYGRAIAHLFAPMSPADSLDALCIASTQSGEAAERAAVARPWRAPHHTVSAGGLTGSGALTRAGEIALAHGGVLYLDEASQFSDDAVLAVQRAVTTARVSVGGAPEASFPARFILAASDSRCLCLSRIPTMCTCDTARVIERRAGAARLASLCDIVVELGDRPAKSGSPTRSDDELRAVVSRAREMAMARQGVPNGRLGIDSPDLRPIVRRIAVIVPGTADVDMGPTARLARTLADLEAREVATDNDICTAVAMRSGLR